MLEVVMLEAVVVAVLEHLAGRRMVARELNLSWIQVPNGPLILALERVEGCTRGCELGQAPESSEARTAQPWQPYVGC